MQFLKTLFWVALTVVLVLFAKANWRAATIELWGGLEADIKIPILVFGSFLVGFLPTFLLYRARLWSLRRRMETQQRNAIEIRDAELHRPLDGDAEAQADTRSPNPGMVSQIP